MNETAFKIDHWEFKKVDDDLICGHGLDNEPDYCSVVYYYPSVNNWDDIEAMFRQEDFPLFKTPQLFNELCDKLGYSFPESILKTLKQNIQWLIGNEVIDGINPKLMRDIIVSRHYLTTDDWVSFKNDIGPRRMKYIYESKLCNPFWNSYDNLAVSIHNVMSYFGVMYPHDKLNLCYQVTDDSHSQKILIPKNYTFEELFEKLINSINYGEYKRLLKFCKKELEYQFNLFKKYNTWFYDDSICEKWNTEYQLYDMDKRIKMEEFIHETTLKEFDLRLTFINSPKFWMYCKIKDIRKPSRVQKNDKRISVWSGIDEGDYVQSCIIYDVDTNKEIKGLLLDDIADFDKWENICDVKILAKYFPNESRPLLISKMEIISFPENNNLSTNRNQETPGYDKWRNAIIKRDKVCQCCGLDKHLEAHHQFGYAEHPELATDLSNGIALCKFCHDKYHSIYGLKNINPRDLVEFVRKYGVR